MIVMTVWGGEKDLWNCGQTLCADYRPSSQAGSNYFAAQPDPTRSASQLDSMQVVIAT